MKKTVLVIGISLFASLLWLSCGGGGSGGGGVGDLQGTWLGWITYEMDATVEFGLEIDGSGNVLDVQIGGASIGDTGHINLGEDENSFHILYPGGLLGHGIMIVDDQYSHAVYGNYAADGFDYYHGVLEKGAAAAPVYTISDIVGGYPVGGVYEGTAGFWEGEEITMTVGPAPELDFTGNAPDGPFFGSFDLYDPDYGLYAGPLNATTMSLDIRAFVSPDGNAVAAFAVEKDVVPDELEDWMLIGLTK